MPKFNLYQSLHTTVVGPRASRSRCRSARRRCTGAPSSASPRTGATRSASRPRTSLWLQRMVDWQQETSDPGEFMESLKIDLEHDEVFVFTPKGKVITLADRAPPRSTSRTRSTPRSVTAASARGSTGASSRSTRRWRRATPSRSSRARSRARARAATGCSSCRRPRARTKIRQWFSRERRVDAIDTGRDELVKALRKEGLPVQKLAASTRSATSRRRCTTPTSTRCTPRSARATCRRKAVVQRLQRELRGGEEQLPVTARRPPARRSGATPPACTSRASTT